MRGISEKDILDLPEIFDQLIADVCEINGDILTQAIIGKVKELNDWKRIDENTPKDCPISLLTEYNTAVVGYFDVRDGCFWANGMNRFYKITPKAWQCLPTLPKENL